MQISYDINTPSSYSTSTNLKEIDAIWLKEY